MIGQLDDVSRLLWQTRERPRLLAVALGALESSRCAAGYQGQELRRPDRSRLPRPVPKLSPFEIGHKSAT